MRTSTKFFYRVTPLRDGAKIVARYYQSKVPDRDEYEYVAESPYTHEGCIGHGQTPDMAIAGLVEDIESE